MGGQPHGGPQPPGEGPSALWGGASACWGGAQPRGVLSLWGLQLLPPSPSPTCIPRRQVRSQPLSSSKILCLFGCFPKYLLVSDRPCPPIWAEPRSRITRQHSARPACPQPAPGPRTAARSAEGEAAAPPRSRDSVTKVFIELHCGYFFGKRNFIFVA